MGALFNGGPVDGGTFPAQIWGAYMKAASASGNCGDFAKPDHPFQTKPFFGKYATGQARTGTGFEDPRGFDSVPDPTRIPGDGTTGGEGFDPGAYEAPPVDPPPPPPPPPADDGNSGPGGGAEAPGD